MLINNSRIAHMHGVAEWMYKHASEYGLSDDKMYLLGLLHDIGYIYGKTGHEKNGAKLLGEDTYLGRLIACHSLTPDEYKALYNCNDTGIPNELILLWSADSIINNKGREVSYDARLKEIASYNGIDSKAYLKQKETIEWLKEHEKERKII